MPTNPRMTRAQAAEFLGIPAHTLENWVGRHMGPPYYKVGKRVWYDQRDLDAWVQTCRRDPQAERPARQPKEQPAKTTYQKHLAIIRQLRGPNHG